MKSTIKTSVYQHFRSGFRLWDDVRGWDGVTVVWDYEMALGYGMVWGYEMVLVWGYEMVLVWGYEMALGYEMVYI